MEKTMSTYQDRVRQLNLAVQHWQQRLEKTAISGKGSRMGQVLGGLDQMLNQGVQTSIGGGLGYAKGKLEDAYIYDQNMSPEMRQKLLLANVAGGAALGNPTARRAVTKLSPTLQTAAGAGMGYGKSLYEDANVYDPNMSPEMRNQLKWFNIAGGAALGNPKVRRTMFSKNINMHTPVPPAPPGTGFLGKMKHWATTSPSQHVTYTAGSPFAAMSAPTIYAGAPYMGNMFDTARKFTRGAQKVLSDDKVHQFINDPTGYVKDVATSAASEAAKKSTKELGESPAAHAFAGGLANTIGGGLGGSLVGGLGGTLAGQLLARDDEMLDYKTRRRRETIRDLLGLGGGIAGGVAGPLLLNKYAPNLIPGLVDKQMGPASAPAPKK